MECGEWSTGNGVRGIECREQANERPTSDLGLVPRRGNGTSFHYNLRIIVSIEPWNPRLSST